MHLLDRALETDALAVRAKLRVRGEDIVGARSTIGLDIGTSGVRAAELTVGRNGPRLDRFGQVAVPVGAVNDGEVIDVDIVAGALKKLWSEAKFSSKHVALGVANQKVVVRQADIPWMEQAELRKALAFQVADLIPMPIDQAILDFHPLEEFVNDSGARMLRVLLVAASRDMVSSALAAVEKAGLRPTSVDLSPFALIRSLANRDHLGMEVDAEALIDIGARVTNIAVHQGGIPRFVRILLMGGGDLTDAVAERMGVPVDEAELAKQQLGIPGDASERDAHPAGRVIESSVTTFVEEVRGSLDYYLASPGATPIRHVVVGGGGARLRNLAARLSTATRLPVEYAKPMAALRIGKTGLSADQLAYIEPLVAVPVGLALGVAS
jgi:type IV pilus assembly protein PilM